MKTTDILAKEVQEYFQKKYDGEVVIKNITFTHGFKFDNKIMKFNKSFEIHIGFDFTTTIDVYTWNAPRTFESKVSFENACEMVKMALDGYIKSIFFEKDIDANALPNENIRRLLNTEYKYLTSEDFDEIISFYVKQEKYEIAELYKRYKENYEK